jgi:hypothetical protein
MAEKFKFHVYRHDVHAQIDALITGVHSLEYVQSRKTFYQNRDARFQLSFGGFGETEKQEASSNLGARETESTDRRDAP